jgi:hypothetical protein
LKLLRHTKILFVFLLQVRICVSLILGSPTSAASSDVFSSLPFWYHVS